MSGPRHYLRRTPPPFDFIPHGESWRDAAACANHPTLPVYFWDDSVHGENDRARVARVKRAQEVCAGCPVSAQCLADAVPAYDEGIRGGVDLRALYRRKRRAS